MYIVVPPRAPSRVAAALAAIVGRGTAFGNADYRPRGVGRNAAPDQRDAMVLVSQVISAPATGHHNAIRVAAVDRCFVMSHLGSYFVTDKELAIIQAARAVVVDWLQAPVRRPFRESVLRQADPVLLHYGLTAGDYPAFRRVANLIRTGKGHPTENPAPLIAATRDLPDNLVTLD
jgi:hypothetical protein